MNLSSAFVDFAQLGADWVLWVLIALSVVSVGVMIDRYLWLRQRDTDTEAFLREVRGAFQRDELERLQTKYKDNLSIPVHVALRGIAERANGPDAVAEAMHAERARWRKGADRNLMLLGTLGNNVPFIGLFGTVLGVINAFQNLTLKTAEAEAATLGAIAEALVATAVGLLVAIPAVIAFNTFTRKIKLIMGSADEVAHSVLSMIYSDKYVAPAAKAAEKAE
ncbi:MAG: MotA/TolQ/ExbB proton channel family protein [Kofleriaceae bacterium]